MWQLDELLAILSGIHALLAAARWSPGDFQRAMWIDSEHPLYLGIGTVRVEGIEVAGGLTTGAAHINPHITMDLPMMQAESKDDPAYLQLIEITMVHELAHVWDRADHTRLSQGLAQLVNTGGGTKPWLNRTEPFPSKYALDSYPGQSAVSGSYSTGYREEWADTVVAVVYSQSTGVNQQYSSVPFNQYCTAATYVEQQFTDVRTASYH